MALPLTDELRWMARALSSEPNSLRRRIDRWAAGVMAGLVLLALALLPIAAIVGRDVHRDLLAEAAVQSRTHREVTAQLVEPARPQVVPGAHPQTQLSFAATARWTDPDGRQHTAPLRVGAAAEPGDRLVIWVGEAGTPVAAPLTPERALSSAISTGVLVVIGGGTACAVALIGVRALADAAASAAWAREWAEYSRRWTDRGPRGAG